MGERLTRAQAARRVGVSRQRIDAIIAEGRLKEEGATVDADEVDAVWSTIDPDYAARRDAAAKPAVDPKVAALFNQAKTKKELLRVQELELNLKVKQGAFVPRQLVTQQAYAVSKLVTTKLQNLPRQMAPQLAILLEPAEIEDLLSKEVDKLLQDLRDGLAELGDP